MLMPRKYAAESERLKTFTDFPADSPLSHTVLAEAGFLATGTKYNRLYKTIKRVDTHVCTTGK